MASKRVLAAVLTAGLAAGGGLAQTPPPAADPGLPATSNLGTPPGKPTAPATPPASSGTGNPMLAPPAVPAPSATGVLTAPQGVAVPAPATTLPPGAYAGPYCGPGRPGCNGPVGGNGPLTYELYLYTGPSFIVGGDKEFNAALGTGWAVSGGGKTLHFNQGGDAAWVLTTGVTYLYSGGDRDYIGVATRPAPGANGVPVAEPVNAYKVKAFNRPAVEFMLGRDWWLNGPAAVGQECGSNVRVGFDVGGRYGHNSLSLVPLGNPGDFFRRSSVYHAVTIGAHYTWEVPMGAWIGFVGGRVQWARNFTNVAPPVGSDTQDVGIYFTTGVRF